MLTSELYGLLNVFLKYFVSRKWKKKKHSWKCLKCFVEEELAREGSVSETSFPWGGQARPGV